MPTCMSPFAGLKVAKNATTSPSNISPLTEANIKLQFLLLSASWPPWNLITVMYCPECSPRPGRKRQPIPLPAKLGQDSWSHFKPFESVLQENFVTALHYCRNEWVHKVWTGIVGRSRSHHISLPPPLTNFPVLLNLARFTVTAQRRSAVGYLWIWIVLVQHNWLQMSRNIFFPGNAFIHILWSKLFMCSLHPNVCPIP